MYLLTLLLRVFQETKQSSEKNLLFPCEIENNREVKSRFTQGGKGGKISEVIFVFLLSSGKSNQITVPTIKSKNLETAIWFIFLKMV